MERRPPICRGRCPGTRGQSHSLVVTMSFRHVMFGLAFAALSATSLSAQGAVSGQISLKERPGDETEDMTNAVVYLELVGGAKAKLPTTNTSMAMQARQFAPRVRVITEGSKIEFPNQDPFNHNVFSKAAQGPFDMDSYGKGKSKDNAFKTAGIYPIYCNVHPRMTAFVITLKTPHFTQVSKDGRFSIEHVPAGNYKMHVWHDR